MSGSRAFQIQTGNSEFHDPVPAPGSKGPSGVGANGRSTTRSPKGRVGKRGARNNQRESNKRHTKARDRQTTLGTTVPSGRASKASSQIRIKRGPHAGDIRRPAPNRKKHLVFDQIRELINALAYSETTKPSLNAFITIIWNHDPNFDEATWAETERLLWIKIRQWLKRKGYDHRCIWVRESGNHKKAHLHALIYLPNGLGDEFEAFVKRSANLSSGGLKIKRSKTAKARVGLLRYFMKTANRHDFQYRGGDTVNVSDLLGNNHSGTRPPVSIQRYGVTHNLGPTPRRKSGFKDAKILEDVAERLVQITQKARLG